MSQTKNSCARVPKTCLVCYNMALLTCLLLFQKVFWAKLVPFAKGAQLQVVKGPSMRPASTSSLRYSSTKSDLSSTNGLLAQMTVSSRSGKLSIEKPFLSLCTRFRYRFPRECYVLCTKTTLSQTLLGDALLMPLCCDFQ